MDVIGFSEAATANSRIEIINANPDSTSGIVTVPKTIASGETITIPAGRIAVLPNIQIDGTLDVQGDVFIPSGATYGDLDAQIALKAPLASPALTGTPTAPTQTAGDNSTKLATTAYVDGKFIRGTAVASTSGTSIDFVGIPSWAKRITIMLNGVSTSGTSFVQLQVGYTTISTSGYLSSSCLVYGGNQTLTTSATSGFVIAMNSSVDLRTGSLVLNNISGNGYILSGSVGSGNTVSTSNGYVSLSGVLDRVRITTANGTDTFDAGQINIMYEG